MAGLTVFQMNDTHAYIDMHPELFWEQGQAVYRPAGGYGRIAALVNEARREQAGGVLLLDNGDTLHGTYPAVQTQGQALIPLLNALEPEAMTAHWEFAYGPQTFKERAAGLSYPVLALNVTEQETGRLFFDPYRVLEIADLRIGIIGLASNIVDKTMPPSFSQGLQFSLGKDELPGVVHTLRSQEQVDLVILLSHLGFPQDLKLLAETHGIDLCLSGHTHNRLFAPVRQNETLVMQSGSHGSFLGRIDLEIDNGRVVDFHHRLIEVSESIQPDPEMEARVRAALQPNEPLRQEVVGETLAALDRGLNLETTMDNLLLQSLLESSEAQIAFSNGWRYGAPIPPGPVTQDDLYNIIPVNPPVSTVALSGEEIWEMLEENLEHTFSRDPYLQMGGYVKRCLGLKVLFKVENPSGQRIQKVFVGNEPLQSGRVYPAVFVTEQGVPARYGSNRQKLDLRAVDALRNYLGKHSPVRVGLQGTFVLV